MENSFSENNSEKIEEIKKELIKEVKKFFKKRGGWENRQHTSLDGSIHMNTGYSIFWNTTNKEDLTGKQAWKIGYELNTKLSAILKKYNSNLWFEFVTNNDKDNKMYLKLIFSERIEL